MAGSMRFGPQNSHGRPSGSRLRCRKVSVVAEGQRIRYPLLRPSPELRYPSMHIKASHSSSRLVALLSTINAENYVRRTGDSHGDDVELPLFAGRHTPEHLRVNHV